MFLLTRLNTWNLRIDNKKEILRCYQIQKSTFEINYLHFRQKTGNDMKNYYRTVYHKTQVSTKFTRKFFIKTTPNKQSHVKNALKIKIDQIVIEFHWPHNFVRSSVTLITNWSHICRTRVKKEEKRLERL